MVDQSRRRLPAAVARRLRLSLRPHPRQVAVLAALGVTSLGIALVVAITSGRAAEPLAGFVELRPPPAREQVEANTAHLEGPRTIFTDPAPAAPAQVGSFGPYRIIGAGYAGILSYERQFEAPPRGFRSNDPAALAGSPLYLDISDLLPGWKRVSVHTGDGDSETVLQQVFSGPGGETLRFTRIRRSHYPIDVFAPPMDRLAPLALELTTVSNLPAYVVTRTARSPIPTPFTYVSFVDGPIESVLDADGIDASRTLDLAARIAAVTDNGSPRSELP